jgi:hypothetical protein
VANSDNQDRKPALRDYIDDPVLADSEAPEPGELSFENSTGKRLFGEAVNYLSDPETLVFRDLAERFGSA